MKHGPLLWVLDAEIDVPPYARMNVIAGAEGEPTYVGNAEALARLKDFYSSLTLLVGYLHQAPAVPLEGPLDVVIRIFKRQWGRGDTSNLAKSAEDGCGMNRGKKKAARAGIWKDDGQIRRLDCRVVAPMRVPRLLVYVYRDLSSAEVLEEVNLELDEVRAEWALVSGARA